MLRQRAHRLQPVQSVEEIFEEMEAQGKYYPVPLNPPPIYTYGEAGILLWDACVEAMRSHDVLLDEDALVWFSRQTSDPAVKLAAVLIAGSVLYSARCPASHGAKHVHPREESICRLERAVKIANGVVQLKIARGIRRNYVG